MSIFERIAKKSAEKKEKKEILERAKALKQEVDALNQNLHKSKGSIEGLHRMATKIFSSEKINEELVEGLTSSFETIKSEFDKYTERDKELYRERDDLAILASNPYGLFADDKKSKDAVDDAVISARDYQTYYKKILAIIINIETMIRERRVVESKPDAKAEEKIKDVVKVKEKDSKKATSTTKPILS